MTALIVCVSVSHGNTRRVAEAMGEVLGARVVEPEEVDQAEVAAADLLLVGSGIYGWSFHWRLASFVDRLPEVDGTPAVVFWTSGAPEPRLWPYGRSLVKRLEAKGYAVKGTFSCRGWDTFLPLRLIGGLHKGRPNDADLAAARRFAQGLRPVLAP